MTLDLSVLGRDGTPELTLSIGVELHHELMAEASRRNLSAFQAFTDYYADTDIAAIDLLHLAEQEVMALKLLTTSVELRIFLENFGKLIAHTASNDKAIHTIAD